MTSQRAAKGARKRPGRPLTFSFFLFSFPVLFGNLFLVFGYLFASPLWPAPFCGTVRQGQFRKKKGPSRTEGGGAVLDMLWMFNLLCFPGFGASSRTKPGTPEFALRALPGSFCTSSRFASGIPPVLRVPVPTFRTSSLVSNLLVAPNRRL